MATKPVLLDEDDKALAWRLSFAHLGLTIVLGAWLILKNASLNRGDRSEALDWQMAVSLMKVMHLPFTLAEQTGALAGLSWSGYFLIAVALGLIGSAGWGFCTAWLVAAARRAFGAW